MTYQIQKMKRQLTEWEKMFANVASITLISTSDKNITKKENYRSISLMNMDAQILQKICKTNSRILKMIIHHDLVVFISDMQEWFNIHKAINLIHYINKLKNKDQISF